ncbi:MAG: sugar ABC transporter substrate-binding protein [Halothiobacillaceae bacterium]|nr:sugar ABC transporter substrate-binding protein [Halothiobacillaceae bacterium]
MSRISRLLLVASIVLLGGCRSEQTVVTELHFWAMGREGEMVQRLIPEFEAAHPDIRVRVQQIPWSAAHEKLLTAHVGETMPDVFQVGNTWLAEFVALDAVLRLDDWMSRPDAPPAGDFFAGILEGNRIGATLYGLPWYVDTRVLFYRKDLLARAGIVTPPRSWPEFVSAMRRAIATPESCQNGLLLPINEWQGPIVFGLQQGATFLRDGDRYGDFESPAFRRAFDFHGSLYAENLAPALGATQVSNVYQAFASGQFCFFLSGPWNIGEMGRRLPPAVQAHWDVMPLPAPEGSGWPGTSLAGGASLAIHRDSPNKEAAWALVSWLSRSDISLRFFELTGDLPPRIGAWEQGRLAERPRMAAFREQLERVRPVPRIPEWERIAYLVGRYTELAVRGALSRDAALAALDADVDRVLEKRRWLLEREAATR